MYVKNVLKELIGKENIFFIKRGNTAILKALSIAKEKGRKRVIIQDQGGWITYTQYAKKRGFSIIEIKTGYGLISLDDLKRKGDNSCVLLINSMPGYYVYENMAAITKICEEKEILLINDVSGSIGNENAKYGDIIIGSFGKWKPLDIGKGGFIASNEEIKGEEFEFSDVELERLSIRLKKLQEQTENWIKIQEKVKQDLKEFEVVYPRKPGFNVIVKYNNEDEKTGIEEYAEKEKIPITHCPRHIRIKEKAICFEVKRL